MRFGFRLLTDDDLPLLHAWLNEPGVVRWWQGEDVSREAVVRDYGSGNTDPTDAYIVTLDGRDLGWSQCYATASYPQETEVRHWWALGVDKTAGGIDYLIGEPAERGRGLGPAMIRAFTLEVCFGGHPEWTQVCASPQEANRPSWRALHKAGFEFGGMFTDEKVGRCRLMIASRDRYPTVADGAGRRGVAGTPPGALHI